ncbi:MAG: hypothetical protein O3A46_17610, partial [Candidatus Poribacteria bacterium]|nr:hypothetical protein [Candidatus Poribacteria bacterium]
LFGSILDNSAVLRLYACHQCFTDGFYPGIGGVEIRSVVNPLGFGKNVLLLGGSDVSQVREAVIGLHRSFKDVTVEKDRIVRLRRLNFAVSHENPHWLPTERDVKRILKVADDRPESRFARAADFLLYHYQTDDHEWAKLARRLVEPMFERAADSSDVWKFIVGWSLVQSSPAFEDDFRLATDRLLLSVGYGIADSFEPPSADPSLRRESTSYALALRRIGEHFKRVYGEDPFSDKRDTISTTFHRDDPGAGLGNERDWLAVDHWLSVLLQDERYDLLESGILTDLSREILASTDNLKSPIGDADNDRHAHNVLLKIAAFEDDGKPLWLRRWLSGDAAADDPRDAPTKSWAWYTGMYAPDKLPMEPRDIPRIHPMFADTERRTLRSITLRRDLSPSTEFLSLGGDGAIRRLTWKGRAWLEGGTWRNDSNGELLSLADLPNFGYVAIRPDSWTRHIFWRFGRFFFLLGRR